ncbi:MAG: tetratricopeptide repeat protein [Proteobacteria bacterium]|nr:tetratricopeptide repeat protein [Pseudomonadota bacterium]
MRTQPTADWTPFAAAKALHQQGRLSEAAHEYEALLRADPVHLDTLLHFGVLCLQQNRLEDAIGLLRNALERDPTCAAAHANLGAALQAQGRLADAIIAHEAAVAADPAMADAQYGLAEAYREAGRLEDALSCFQRVITLQPEQPEGHYAAATVLQALQRFDEAATFYRAAIGFDPDFAEAQYGLGATLQRLGRHDDAYVAFQAALDVDPDYMEAHLGLGSSLLLMLRAEAALEHLDKALALAPDSIEVQCRRADVLVLLDRIEEAEHDFRRIADVEPERIDALLGLAAVLAVQRREREAATLFDRALAVDPDHPRALVGLGHALLALNREDEALKHLERATELEPSMPGAWQGVGRTREQLGDINGAKAAFQTALELAPHRPGLYLSLFNVTKLRRNDPRLATLEALDPEGMTETEAMTRLFALGKAYDDIGEKANAFDCLLEGNARKRRTVTYDERAAFASSAQVRAIFSPAMISHLAGWGEPSEVPIFILGMPRSGSTLIEQILASHHQVIAGGERKDFGQSLQQILQAVPANTGDAEPDAVLSLDPTTMQRLGRSYLDLLPPLTPGRTRVTDKMPGNFRLAGLIHLALPRAKIIHTCRDPVDTCLSCFSKLFGDELNFTYDLGELGRYYHDYLDTMAHWRAALPPGVMLDVRYEEVVADLEGMIRRLLEFCGLPWDDACLAFHRTQRAVRTASVAQVRQPLYSSSVGKWRPDDAVLRPLLDGIAGQG